MGVKNDSDSRANNSAWVAGWLFSFVQVNFDYHFIRYAVVLQPSEDHGVEDTENNVKKNILEN